MSVKAKGDHPDKEPIHAEEDDETRKKRERFERELMQRWSEDYFEIIEQLPLELQRSYTLMRELETKFQDRIDQVARQTLQYRDARLAYSRLAAREKEAYVPGSFASSKESSDRADRVVAQVAEASEVDVERVDDAEVFQVLSGEKFVPEEHSLPLAANSAAAQITSRPIIERFPVPHTEPPLRAARLEMLSGIAKASTEAIRAAEEKVGLAVTAYDWVDRQIRRLDADLQKSENSLLLGLRAGTEASRGLQDALGVNFNGQDGKHRWEDVERLLLGRSDGSAPSNADGGLAAPAIPNRKKRGKLASAHQQIDDVELTANDMAIDPNEPTYCYCDQVSYGDMVACDNEDCPREWFHYACIGIRSPPKGRWFCLFCAPPGYRGSGTYPNDAPCLPEAIKASLSSYATSAAGKKRKKK
jgi:hypothetical protein